jgi:hypothetical protein
MCFDFGIMMITRICVHIVLATASSVTSMPLETAVQNAEIEYNIWS